MTHFGPFGPIRTILYFNFSGTCKFKTTSKVSTFKGIKVIADSVETCEDELNQKVSSSAAFKETLLTKQGCKKVETPSGDSSEDDEVKWVDANTGAVCELEVEASCEENTSRRRRSSRSANSEFEGELNVTSKKSSAVVEESSDNDSEDSNGDGTDDGSDAGSENNTGSNTDGNNDDDTEDNTDNNTEDNTEDNETASEDQEEKLEDFTVADIVEAINAVNTEEAENKDESEDNSEGNTEEKPTAFFEIAIEEDEIEVENEEVKETTEEVDTENVETVDTNIPEEEEETEDNETGEEVEEEAEEENASSEKIEELEKLVQELKTENEALDSQIELLEENYEKLEGEIEDVSSKQKKSRLLGMMQQSRSSVEIFNLKKQMEQLASQFYNGMAQTLTLLSPQKST